jgi:hypothetical protein
MSCVRFCLFLFAVREFARVVQPLYIQRKITSARIDAIPKRLEALELELDSRMERVRL